MFNIGNATIGFITVLGGILLAMGVARAAITPTAKRFFKDPQTHMGRYRFMAGLWGAALGAGLAIYGFVSAGVTHSLFLAALGGVIVPIVIYLINGVEFLFEHKVWQKFFHFCDWLGEVISSHIPGRKPTGK